MRKWSNITGKGAAPNVNIYCNHCNHRFLSPLMILQVPSVRTVNYLMVERNPCEKNGRQILDSISPHAGKTITATLQHVFFNNHLILWIQSPPENGFMEPKINYTYTFWEVDWTPQKTLYTTYIPSWKLTQPT